MNDMAARIAVAAASGDVQTLATLAIELAQENARLAGHAAALEEAEAARKSKQAERTRRHRNVTQRDATLQNVTERDRALPPSSPSPSLLSPTPPNNPSPTPSTPDSLRSADVERVVAHYRALHPRRKPGPKDRRAVAKALGLGYSAEELCEAVSGNAADDWHRDKAKHELPYVLRDNGLIDGFREKAVKARPVIVNGWFAEGA